MNLDGLKRDVERRLARIEAKLAFYALKDDARGLDRRRYGCLSGLHVEKYVQRGDSVVLHRSLMPPDERGLGATAPVRRFHWDEWTTVAIDGIGDCVRVLVPGYGGMPIPRGEFVQAVLSGHVRAPAASVVTAEDASCSDS
jgi:hypothetical protein